MPSHNPLKQLLHLDRSSTDFHDQVSNILQGEEYNQWVPSIQGDDLVGIVNYLDKVRRHVSPSHSPLKLPQTLDDLDPSDSAFRRCLRELRHICGTRTVLPASYTFSSRNLNIGPRPVASGGSGDVYEGSLSGLKVCAKRVRVYSKDGPTSPTKVC